MGTGTGTETGNTPGNPARRRKDRGPGRTGIRGGGTGLGLGIDILGGGDTQAAVHPQVHQTATADIIQSHTKSQAKRARWNDSPKLRDKVGGKKNPNKKPLRKKPTRG